LNILNMYGGVPVRGLLADLAEQSRAAEPNVADTDGIVTAADLVRAAARLAPNAQA